MAWPGLFDGGASRLVDQSPLPQALESADTRVAQLEDLPGHLIDRALESIGYEPVPALDPPELPEPGPFEVHVRPAVDALVAILLRATSFVCSTLLLLLALSLRSSTSTARELRKLAAQIEAPAEAARPATAAGRMMDRRDPVSTSPAENPSPVTTIVSGLTALGHVVDDAAARRRGGCRCSATIRAPPDASNPRGYLEYAPVRGSRRNTSWLDRAGGRAVKVVHVLLPSLPEDRRYRVLLMRRPIDQIIASQNRMLERMGKSPTPIDDQRLGEIMEAQVEEARSFLSERACFEWIEVAYPRLVEAPGVELERILEFLDLNAPIELLTRCIDPALHRERAPARG